MFSGHGGGGHGGGHGGGGHGGGHGGGGHGFGGEKRCCQGKLSILKF